jgi:hypothetical protein
MNKTKNCNRCKNELTLDKFWINRQSKDGFFGNCKECQRAKKCEPGFKLCSKCFEVKNNSEYLIVGKSKRLARYCNKCSIEAKKEKRLRKIENDNKYYYSNHSEIREQQVNARLLKRYGITINEYNKKFEEQDGRCMICSKEHISEKRMHVDHDHETGQVRGLLCAPCNNHLGILENEEWVKKAKSYLELWIRTL